jgi:hypothetical protein
MGNLLIRRVRAERRAISTEWASRPTTKLGRRAAPRTRSCAA